MTSLNNLQRNNNNKTSSSSRHGKLGFRQVSGVLGMHYWLICLTVVGITV